jgi:queuine tRNA-ribosyltransferase
MLGPMLLTWHNIAYYQQLMRGLRRAILERRFDAHVGEVSSGWESRET